MFIEPIPEGEAGDELAGQYAADRTATGEIPNYTRAFSPRPNIYTAWKALSAEIGGRMDPRRYELVTLAAARVLRSSYCALAHGSILLDRFLDAETLERTAVDHRAAGLEPVDVAVMDLAEQVVRDATAVTQADIDRLRDLGLTDGEIVEVVAAAAVRCFFSKTLDALGAQPDARYGDLEPAPLREALTFGRPIA